MHHIVNDEADKRIPDAPTHRVEDNNAEDHDADFDRSNYQEN